MQRALQPLANVGVAPATLVAAVERPPLRREHSVACDAVEAFVVRVGHVDAERLPGAATRWRMTRITPLPIQYNVLVHLERCCRLTLS